MEDDNKKITDIPEQEDKPDISEDKPEEIIIEEPKEEKKEEVEELKEEKPKEKFVKEEIKEKPKKPCGFWKALTIILFILLIISIFTHGFRFGGITGKVTGSGTGVTILSDVRCKDCDTTPLIEQLNMLFPNLKINELDYGTDEGKAIYDELELQYLPAVLFDKSIESSEQYNQLAMYLMPAGDYLSLKVGAEFDPKAEICDNGIDDTGNNLIDCEDPDCANKLICREEISRKLDLFVMSQCPFGTKALDAMEEVLEVFDDIKFDVHYIAMENDDGTFNSLHGQAEVDENIRQLCAKKYYEANNKYMKYIWCRDRNIQSSDWEQCAEKNGMSVTKIKACSEGDEGKQLLSEDIMIAQELGIGASPTWIANNQHQFGGIDAEVIRQNFCEHNPDLTGCNTTLSSSDVEGEC